MLKNKMYLKPSSRCEEDLIAAKSIAAFTAFIPKSKRGFTGRFIQVADFP